MVGRLGVEYNKKSPAEGTKDFRQKRINVRFPEELWKQMRLEALSRGWGMQRMIRHLCEASIEGIE